MRTIALISSTLLLSACIAQPIAMTTTPRQVAVHEIGVADGDAAEGHSLFAKLRCDTCHSVAGQRRGSPHPLPDLTAQPPEAVAALITQRGELAPEALFDEMAMSSAVSQMTPQDLAHLVAFLRNPSGQRRPGTD